MFKKFFGGGESEEVKSIREVVNQKDYGKALGMIKDQFREGNHDPNLYKLASEAIGFLGGQEESELFQKIAKTPKNAKGYFDLGYHFMEVNHPTLAEPILKKGNELDPQDPDIVLELALSYAYQQNTKKARETLLPFAAEIPSIWYLYAIARYGLLEKDVELSESIVEQVLSSEEKNEEKSPAYGMFLNLRDSIERYKKVGEPKQEIRDWHYIQYGSVVLHLFEQKEIAGGRYVAAFLNYETFKTLMGKFEIFWGKHLKDKKIEHVTSFGNRGSKLMGMYLAKKLNLEHVHLEYPKDGNYIGIDSVKESHLIVSDSARNFNLLLGAQDRTKGHVLFALNQEWLEVHSVAVDVCGMISQSITFPWTGGGMSIDKNGELKKEEADTRDLEVVLEEIENLPAGDLKTQDLSWYEGKDLLFGYSANNKSQNRSAYEPTSPVVGNQFG